jgi:O-antigen/teichoic acid export membrane protein
LPAIALAYTASAAVQKGFGLLVLLWVAYVLPAGDYAIFGLLWALQVGVATLAGAGITESVVGLLKDHATQQARAQLFSAANGAFAYLVVSACALSTAVYLLPFWTVGVGPGTRFSVVVCGLLMAFLTLHANLVRLEERHAASIALGTVAPVFGQLFAFTAFFIFESTPAFYAALAAGLVVVLVPLYHRGLGHFHFALTWTETALVRRTLRPYVVIAFLSWVGGYGYTYVVGSMFTAADVARFAFAYTLSSVMHLVATSMNQAWSPRFFKLVHVLPIADMEARNLRFFAIQGAALGLMGALMLLAFPVVLDGVGGNLGNYRDMGLELGLLLFGYAIAIPWWHSQNYYLVHGFAAEMRNVVLVTTIIGLLAWLALMSLMGSIGVYVGFAAQMLIRSVGIWIWARRWWPIGIAWHGPVIAGVLLGAAGLAAHTLLSTNAG